MESVRIISQGQYIDGTIIKPATPREKLPGVIFFHGMTSNQDRYIPISQKLADRGITGMTLSIRGHGTSEGNFEELTIHDAIADGIAAYDFFAKQNFLDHSRIGICGASLGGAIAATLAAERDVKSLVLRAPATYSSEMKDMTYTQIMATEIEIFNRMGGIEKTPPVHALADFTGSLLVVTSEHDHVIPAKVSEAFLKVAKHAAKKEMLMIKGATHHLAQDSWREQFINATINWLSVTL